MLYFTYRDSSSLRDDHHKTTNYSYELQLFRSKKTSPVHKHIISNGVSSLRKRFPLFIAFFFLCVLSPIISASNKSLNIGEAIDQLIDKHHLSQARIGIKIVTWTNNKNYTLIYEKNPDVLLTPASNIKLFTAATALCLLGPDFKYNTTLSYDGSINDGLLKGNLIIRGEGDPNISGRFHQGHTTAIMEDWAVKVSALGIKQINGNLILDDTAFDRIYRLPTWPQDQLTYWYCAPVSAISFNDNCVDITVYPDQENNQVKYRLDPLTSYVKVINTCRLVSEKSRHCISFHRPDGKNTILLKGEFWQQAQPYKESITIDNPTLYLGAVFKETLQRKAAIQLNGPVKLIDPDDVNPENKLIEITFHQSGLTPTLNIVNKRSQNFYAEQLTKTLGYKFKGLGSWNNGLAVIKDFLQTEVKIPADAYILYDGSGLSRQNRLTAAQITRLLVYMARHKHFDLFRNSLSISGIDGGLAQRLNQPGYQGKVFAKTGYLKNVSTLSGYFLVQDNNISVFSIIINQENRQGHPTQFQDALLKLLIDR